MEILCYFITNRSGKEMYIMGLNLVTIKSLLDILDTAEDKLKIINYIQFELKKMEIEIMTENITSLLIGNNIGNKKYFTVADVFKQYEGTIEYNGIVGVIQTWYYGYLYKDSWCATAMCWTLAQLGLRAYTIGGKYENVYNLKQAFDKGVETGTCFKIDKYEMQYGDIVILCFDNEFTVTAKKHVNSFLNYSDSIPNYYNGIGGNQHDGIIPQQYRIDDIVAVYRPQWDKGTLKSLDNLPKG